MASANEDSCSNTPASAYAVKFASDITSIDLNLLLARNQTAYKRVGGESCLLWMRVFDTNFLLRLNPRSSDHLHACKIESHPDLDIQEVEKKLPDVFFKTYVDTFFYTDDCKAYVFPTLNKYGAVVWSRNGGDTSYWFLKNRQLDIEVTLGLPSNLEELESIASVLFEIPTDYAPLGIGSEAIVFEKNESDLFVKLMSNYAPHGTELLQICIPSPDDFGFPVDSYKYFDDLTNNVRKDEKLFIRSILINTNESHDVLSLSLC